MQTPFISPPNISKSIVFDLPLLHPNEQCLTGSCNPLKCGGPHTYTNKRVLFPTLGNWQLGQHLQNYCRVYVLVNCPLSSSSPTQGFYQVYPRFVCGFAAQQQYICSNVPSVIWWPYIHSKLSPSERLTCLPNAFWCPVTSLGLLAVGCFGLAQLAGLMNKTWGLLSQWLSPLKAVHWLDGASPAHLLMQWGKALVNTYAYPYFTVGLGTQFRLSLKYKGFISPKT